MKPRLDIPIFSIVVLSLGPLGTPKPAQAQGIDPENRPVLDIRVEGLKRVDPQLVHNQIRTKKGDPYNARVVQQDVERITHLGKFLPVHAEVEPQPDGSVVLIFRVVEQPMISDVQVVGNHAVPDQTLFQVVRLRAGDAVDEFLIDRAQKQIIQSYRDTGYFDTTVSIDQELLDETGILMFMVVEGPRLRIRAIKFRGNEIYSDKQLLSKIRSKTYILLLRKGELSRERAHEDAARLRQFYRDRGYLDADAFPEIDVSPDGRDAVVTFTIQEGSQYTVAGIEVDGNEVFTDAAIMEAMTLRVGDVFSEVREKRSREAVTDLYGELGYIEVNVKTSPQFRNDQPHQVDVLVSIVEGKPYWVGTITIKGNQLTKDSVVARQIRGLWPGRRFVRSGIEKTKQRLNQSALFERNRTQVTILGDVEDDERDVLVEVEEKNTGSLGFGAGISSDSGVIGAFDITQRNFDIADFPESPGEFFSGKAFRGAGQFMRIALQPGDRTSRYLINFKEPYLLDSNIFLDTTGFFFERERADYDEQRVGGTFNFGQRFGDVWSASVRTRYELIDIDGIEADAPVDVFQVKGESDLSSLGFSVTRNNVDNRLFPTRGSRIQLGINRVGGLGGDFDFTKATAQLRKYWTVDEDFFGRRTVLSTRIRAGYIFEQDEAPVFERFYAGGHRSLRGFDFRGVGPRGIRNDTGRRGDDPVGGDWLFLLGVEYNFPIYQDVLRWVVFVDTGTVEEDIGLDEYRVAVGTGLRLQVPLLGPTPFAFDFAFPLLKEDEDDERLFSFDLAIPF